MAWSPMLLSDHIPTFCPSSSLSPLGRVSDLKSFFFLHSSLESPRGMEERVAVIPPGPPAWGQKALGAGGRVPGGC